MGLILLWDIITRGNIPAVSYVCAEITIKWTFQGSGMLRCSSGACHVLVPEDHFRCQLHDIQLLIESALALLGCGKPSKSYTLMHYCSLLTDNFTQVLQKGFCSCPLDGNHYFWKRMTTVSGLNKNMRVSKNLNRVYLQVALLGLLSTEIPFPEPSWIKKSTNDQTHGFYPHPHCLNPTRAVLHDTLREEQISFCVPTRVTPLPQITVFNKIKVLPIVSTPVFDCMSYK